ncbi:hypothetical protein [Haladaptatus halobius]|uniref:hypothetical protein n=1 Tax=Haladaptatus halobius TaxID=2884875 RepID=UPI001D0B24D4|nr:hypothetical protein [Haladaptatus halobius]
MSPKCCPKCDQLVLATTIRGLSAITIQPCDHEIADLAALNDVSDLDPLAPGEWLTQFLAESEDD